MADFPEFHEFVTECVLEYREDDKGQRWGQFLFNKLCVLHWGMGEQIRCTPADPFYAKDNNDPRYSAFWLKVQELWPN